MKTISFIAFCFDNLCTFCMRKLVGSSAYYDSSSNLELGLFAILFWVMVVGLDYRLADSESNSHIQPRQTGGKVSV